MSRLTILGIGAAIGAIAGFGLSFTALSPLVIGGIIGFMFFALPTVWSTIGLLYAFYKGNNVNWQDKKSFTEVGITMLLGTAIGVGIGAAASTVSPAIFATWQAIALGAIVGAAALSVGTIVTTITDKIHAEGSVEHTTPPDNSLNELQTTHVGQKNNSPSGRGAEEAYNLT